MLFEPAKLNSFLRWFRGEGFSQGEASPTFVWGGAIG